MKIMFMGTPEISATCLEKLIKDGHNIVATITREDKPRGRGNVMTPTPVKILSLENGIPVYTPATLRDGEFMKLLDEYKPDLIAVVAYGKILPAEVINYPRLGCINLHVSLLPKYRGAAPMQRAIMEGERETGVTIMYMAEGLDTGDMLLKREFKIEDNANFEDIHDGLGKMGAEALIEAIEAIEKGSITRIPQDDSLSTYAKKITKEDCAIDFSKDAQTVHDLIRGLSPIPLSLTHTPNGKLLKIVESRIADLEREHERVGEVISLEDGIEVACARGSVKLLKVLPEGKARMSASDFIRGRNISLGDILS